MTHLLSFRFEITLIVLMRLCANWHLLDNFQSVTFQTHHLARIVREQPNRLQAKVRQNLRAQTIFAKVHSITEFLIGLDRIITLLLQLVRFDFGSQPDAASLLPHMAQHAGTLVGNLLHRMVQLRTTTATTRAKNIAGETLAVNADEHVFFAGDISADQCEMMFPINFGSIQMEIK